MRLKSSKSTIASWCKPTSYAFMAGLALSPMVASAASITESFTVAPQNNTSFGVGDFFISTSSFNQFDPSLGKLTGIIAALSGSATWSSNNNSQPELTANLVDSSRTDIGTVSDNYGMELFQHVGQIGFSIYDPAPGAYGIEGTGQTNFYLGLDLYVGGENAIGYLNTAGLDGNITYNYTPSTPVPEPGSLILLASGLFGLAIIRRRKMI